MPRFDRRNFLAAAASGSLALAHPFATASAIEPIRRQDGPKFKLSLAAYSYRDLLEKPAANYSLQDFVRTCADLQLDATELTSYYFPKQITPEYLRQLKQLAFLLGLDISGTAVANDFAQPAGDKREADLAHVRQWVDYAEILGAPVIRIFSGGRKFLQDAAVAHRLTVEGIEASCDYAGQHGVMLALENHGGLTEHVDDMLAIVRDVKSPWFGVNLDTGNFNSADPYADLAKIAPYAVNVQVKVSVHPAGADRRPADFKRLAAILRDSGYRGYVVLEYEEPQDPRQGVPKALEELRAALA